MGKVKVWLAAIGFLLFLWVLTPSDEEESTSIVGAAAQNKSASPGVTFTDTTGASDPEPQHFQTTQVPVTTSRGNLPLVLGIAHTKALQQAGMMFYRVWPSTMHGLLFLFQEEDSYSMWMRNTYLPLDIVFIDRAGYIVHIEYGTTPQTDTPIKAPVPVLAVLEIPAGSANQWNIKKGDRLRMKYFRSALPAS